VGRLPYCLQVLLENALRHEDNDTVSKDTIRGFAAWTENAAHRAEINFYPGRIMIHDVSGIPLMADLAAMRERVVSLGCNPDAVNPVRPVASIMDHSVIVDVAGQRDALAQNMRAEFARNTERYRVAKWAQKAFRNVHVRPPGEGICHQINLEQLAQVVWLEAHHENGLVAFPDTLVACDSHTPMVNALSVLGWGVGAIECLSCMLGEPASMMIPQVVGVRLVGRVRAGTTTTDLALGLTRTLREVGVVHKFVEFFGPGLDALSVPERATLANMAPEYGASVGFFPTDQETLRYLHVTGRGERAALVEAYCRAPGLWRDDSAPRIYSDIVEFDIGRIQASLAGPRLPQTQVLLSEAHLSASKALDDDGAQHGGTSAPGEAGKLRDGDIVIAAITSCTNTSNPSVMLAAGLLAKKACEKGLKAKPWVKTSLSPGSRVVGDYLRKAGLMAPLEELGFHVTGYGCMTCCGGSGSLAGAIAKDIGANHQRVAAILSGNRNFQGHIHPDVELAYLGSPPLVVAYALLGTLCEDITSVPLGEDRRGDPVYLRDLWPDAGTIEAAIREHATEDLFTARYRDAAAGSALWDAVDAGDGGALVWDAASTYIVKPPFLETAIKRRPMTDIEGAAILAVLGDNVTTDHISPGGQILEGSLAGDFLSAKGLRPAAFSSYLQRRVNHEVMMRGTFNNAHLQNEMTPHCQGGWTVHQPSGETMTIFDAHLRYAGEARALVVVAGKEYGTGSSRDWAAKGPHLLGVQATIAEGFERIHRCNLVGMGILPLQFQNGETRKLLGLEGTESVDITGLGNRITVNQTLAVRFTRPDGTTFEVGVLCRLDTVREIAWFEAGGVMPFALEGLVTATAEQMT
jgi:aconitate hydratase